MIDAFYKFTKLYPAKTTKSAETITCLRKYFSDYSKPRILTFDRRTSFTSQEFLSELDIKHQKVSNSSPQANGEVVIVNKTLEPMLGKLSDHECGKEWPKAVEDIELAIIILFTYLRARSPVNCYLAYVNAEKSMIRWNNLWKIK